MNPVGKQAHIERTECEWNEVKQRDIFMNSKLKFLQTHTRKNWIFKKNTEMHNSDNGRNACHIHNIESMTIEFSVDM